MRIVLSQFSQFFSRPSYDRYNFKKFYKANSYIRQKLFNIILSVKKNNLKKCK